jgi:uncharacterized phage protein gp47/JayE
MAFQIKSFDELTASLLNYMFYTDNNLTDFNIGSSMRSILEAVASEEEEVYFRLWQGVQDAIQKSIFTSFGFTQEPGSGSVGQLEFDRETPALANITIPYGAVVSSPQGKRYQTTSQVILPTGSTFIVASAVALSGGSDTNIQISGTVMQMEAPIYGISSCKTATPFDNGTDLESMTSVSSRFIAYIQSLSRSTNKAIEYGATTAALYDGTGSITEKVMLSKAYDYVDNKGLVNCYIDNGAGDASIELINTAQNIVNGFVSGDTQVEGYKASGVVAVVQVVSALDQSVVASIETTSGFTSVQNNAISAITAYFASLRIESEFVYNKLVQMILDSDTSITDVTLISPSANIVPAEGQRVTLGDVTVTQQ